MNIDKTEILTILSSIVLLPVIKENNLLSQRLDLLKKKVQEQEFQIVILGQFKRGKTTLINALLGAKILPVSIVPLTSVVTILKYGKKTAAKVIYLNGRQEQVILTKIDEYITEIKNPKNVKSVDKVVIEYPSVFLQNGIQIIDTPGVGSVYKHNTDVAYDFVPKADAGIFVFTADPPISESELQFLKSVKDQLGKIIFVQNKIDQISQKDLQESLNFTKNVIKETVSTADLLFFQLSAKNGLEGKLTRDREKLRESRLPDFEEKLINFLMKHKGQIFLVSVTNKLLAIVEEIKFTLEIEKQALLTPIKSLKEKISSFNEEIAAIRQEKEDNDYILQGQMEKLVNQVLIDDIESLKEQQLPLLLNEYESFIKSKKNLSGIELSKTLDQFMEKSIKRIFTNWRELEEDKLQQSLESILDRFSSQTNEFIKKAIKLSANLFNLKVKEFQQDPRLTEKYDFIFSFDEYQINLDLYTPVVSRLPKFLSHRLLYKNMKEKVIQVFDQHCGRSRYDFHQRVLQSINDYRNTLDEVLEETVNGIKIAMQKGLSEQEKNIKKEKDISEVLKRQEMIISEAERKIKDIINGIRN